jgi:hypothetical protein
MLECRAGARPVACSTRKDAQTALPPARAGRRGGRPDLDLGPRCPLTPLPTQLSLVPGPSAADSGSVANLSVSDKGIALHSDLKDRFGNYYPSNFNPFLNASRGGGNMTAADGTRLTVRQDERFVNWMRTAALPRFRKLWGRIDGLGGARTSLEPGDVIVIDVVNRWNTYSFDGQKAIVLVGAGTGLDEVGPGRSGAQRLWPAPCAPTGAVEGAASGRELGGDRAQPRVAA